MKVFEKTKKLVIGVVVGLFVIILFNSSMVSTYPNEYTMVKQFGAVKRIIDNPGLSFKIPMIQSTQTIPKYKMCYDLAPSSVNTSDKKIMMVDSFALWEVSDPLKFVSTLGASVTNAESRIDNTVYNSVKTVLSSTTQDEIISGRDGELSNAITDKIGSSLDMYGIKIYKVETKMLDLPDANKDSVYARMISERNNIAAGYTSQGQSQYQVIKNATDKEVSIKLSEANAKAEQTKAEGEAAYMETLSKAYNDTDKADFYNYVRSLDALKASLKGENKTIILPANSEIAQILLGR